MVLSGIDLNALKVPDRKNKWHRGPIAAQSLANRLIRYCREVWGPFLLLDPFISGGDESDREWIPRRPSGQGGYGSVALWERKRQEHGRVLDEIVIKSGKSFETAP
jgi:hypothetical protein